ncbi:hypothetical protein ACET81_21620, partial [Aeromonas veronii]
AAPGARPPEPVTHQEHHRARGLGHHPAASLTGSAGTAGQRDASSHRSTAAPSPLDHLLQGAAAGPDHSQVMHQAHHRPGDMAIALQRPRQ